MLIPFCAHVTGCVLQEASSQRHFLSNRFSEVFFLVSLHRFNVLCVEFNISVIFSIPLNDCDNSQRKHMLSMTRRQHEYGSIVFIAHRYHFVFLLGTLLG